MALETPTSSKILSFHFQMRNMDTLNTVMHQHYLCLKNILEENPNLVKNLREVGRWMVENKEMSDVAIRTCDKSCRSLWLHPSNHWQSATPWAKIIRHVLHLPTDAYIKGKYLFMSLQNASSRQIFRATKLSFGCLFTHRPFCAVWQLPSSAIVAVRLSTIFQTSSVFGPLFLFI